MPHRRFALSALLFALLSACAHAKDESSDRMGNLFWGHAPAGASLCPAAKEPLSVRELASRVALPPSQGAEEALTVALKGIVTTAISTLSQPLVPAPVALSFEHTLDHDPKMKASKAAVAGFPEIYSWAVCGRIGPSSHLPACRAKAKEAVLSWVRTYAPTGNPINENRLIPILQSLDLLLPVLSSNEKAEAQAWVRALIDRGDEYYRREFPKEHISQLTNNWMSWRLAIRAIAGTLLGGAAVHAQTEQLLKKQIQANLFADGTSFDFRERDALTYHAYDLYALTLILALTPCRVDKEERASILNGIRFMADYLNGKKTHIEFLHTKAKFDVERKEAKQKDFENKNWVPDRDARMMLRLARSIFPEVREWTSSIFDSGYEPRIKLMSALLGETEIPKK